jgi:hypothetical protein
MEATRSTPTNDSGSTADIFKRLCEELKPGNLVTYRGLYGVDVYVVAEARNNGRLISKTGEVLDFHYEPSRFSVHKPTDTDYSVVKASYLQKQTSQRFTAYYSELGADPEVFLTDAKGVIVPPHTIGFSTNKENEIYADGFAAEFKPKQIYCGAYLGDAIRGQLMRIYSNLPEGVKFDTVDYIHVPKRMREAAPPEVVQLGCMPSYHAYGDEPQLTRVDGRRMIHRTAGFHLHVSFENRPWASIVQGRLTRDPYDSRITNIVRCMDMFGGVGMALLLRGLEHPERRKYYGRAGEYRLPSHGGIEYRVHSSRMLTSPATYMAGLELTRLGMILGEYMDWTEFGVSQADVQAAINQLDYAAGMRVYNRVKPWVHRHVEGIGGSARNLDWLMVNGMVNWKSQIDTQDSFSIDLAKNWFLLPNSPKWYGHSNTGYSQYSTSLARFTCNLSRTAIAAVDADATARALEM